ncbi:MAG: hypothetical protein P4M01_13085 [Acidobacteriota bacterium]|nr:hypothetical protein [Acidobacteriota bacterium]
MAHFVCEITSWSLLQPKYCERCGSLWLRPSSSMRKFCGPCTAQERTLREGAGDSFMELWLRSRQEARA